MIESDVERVRPGPGDDPREDDAREVDDRADDGDDPEAVDARDDSSSRRHEKGSSVKEGEVPDADRAGDMSRPAASSCTTNSDDLCFFCPA